MRYLPHSAADRNQMLAQIGAQSLDELFSVIPSDLQLSEPVDLPSFQSEMEVDAYLSSLARRNHSAGEGPFFIGAGAYRHHVPASVDHLIQRSEFLTSYTPYQPEISQGTLQMLFEFQTQVANLTGMELANASMYDGSTATVEAALMAQRITRRQKVVVASGLHPQYAQVLQTYMPDPASLTFAQTSPSKADFGDLAVDEDTAAIILQTPDFFGRIHDIEKAAQLAHAQGALLIVVMTEIVALGVLEAPGALGADIFVAEGSSLGNALNFGGPYLGLFATKQKYVRQMPGRVTGETVDADGARCFTLTLSTREQHIRREKATSNICTNSGLCALAFSIHLSLLGEMGMQRLARWNHANARKLAEKLATIKGVSVLNQSYFNEFCLELPKPAEPVIEQLAEQRILAGVPVSRLLPEQKELQNLILVTTTELNSEADMDQLAIALAEAVQ